MSALFALLLIGCDSGTSTPAANRMSVSQVADPGLPALTGRVVDGAALLDEATRARLSAQSADLERATGSQFVTVTVPSLGERSIEEFGLALGQYWKVGRAEHDDGVLLIVAPKERRVRIEVGRGLERVISNPKAQAIIDDIILPEFRGDRMQQGIVAGADAIVATLAAKERGS